MSQNEQNSGGSNIPHPHEVNEQASQADSDDIIRRARRGDETKGDPDDRDAAGGVRHADTPQGREETKNETPENANSNG